MKITALESFLVEIPQKYPIAPYRSRYRCCSATQSLLIRIETDCGTVGWGEAPELSISPRWMGDEAVTLRKQLIGRDPTDINLLYREWNLDGGYVQSCVEMAVWDIVGKARGQPLFELLGGLVRPRIELAACMGIRPPQEAADIAQRYVEWGFTTMKTKAGRSPDEDLAYVKAIRGAVGDRLRLRIDPNTAYSPSICYQMAKQLEPYHLEYFEQPMAADMIEESARIRRLTDTPLALNESVTTPQAVQRILDLDAAAVLLPDTYQCGGIQAVKDIADLAGAAGIPCVMHCAHDLGPKTAAMLHLVASTPSFSLANDCTYYGLEDDVITEPFQIDRGSMKPPMGPGLGIEVDPAKVRRYQVAASG